VTISAPAARAAAPITADDGNFPVPSRRRDENARPAMISGSGGAMPSWVGMAAVGMWRSLRPYERDQVRGSWASTHLSARSAGLPCDTRQPTRLTPDPTIAAPAAELRDHGPTMSTRYLIIAALVTGLVILAASAIQLLMAR
jgi:hypothetical protein